VHGLKCLKLKHRVEVLLQEIFFSRNVSCRLTILVSGAPNSWIKFQRREKFQHRKWRRALTKPAGGCAAAPDCRCPAGGDPLTSGPAEPPSRQQKRLKKAAGDGGGEQ
jgi:hypothetical protein